LGVKPGLGLPFPGERGGLGDLTRGSPARGGNNGCGAPVRAGGAGPRRTAKPLAGVVKGSTTTRNRDWVQPGAKIQKAESGKPRQRAKGSKDSEPERRYVVTHTTKRRENPLRGL